jgi:hypothetical protein
MVGALQKRTHIYDTLTRRVCLVIARNRTKVDPPFRAKPCHMTAGSLANSHWGEGNGTEPHGKPNVLPRHV